VACTSATSLTAIDFVSGGDTAIAIGVDGLGLLSYWEVGGWDLRVAHCTTTACTSATHATLDSAGKVGNATAVAIGADGLGIIAYRDYDAQRVKVAHCSNTACSSAALTLPDTLVSGGYNGVAIGPDGLPLIANLGSNRLRIIHCGNVACNPYAGRAR
jgi:hypothetical protein